MDKTDLTEYNICAKYITPALKAAGRDVHLQICEAENFISSTIKAIVA